LHAKRGEGVSSCGNQPGAAVWAAPRVPHGQYSTSASEPETPKETLRYGYLTYLKHRRRKESAGEAATGRGRLGDELVWRGSGLAGVAAWSAVCTASGLRRWSRRSASRVPPRALLVNDDTAGLAVQYLRQYCGRRNLRLLMHGCKLRSYRTLTVPKHR